MGLGRRQIQAEIAMGRSRRLRAADDQGSSQTLPAASRCSTVIIPASSREGRSSSASGHGRASPGGGGSASALDAPESDSGVGSAETEGIGDANLDVQLPCFVGAVV